MEKLVDTILSDFTDIAAELSGYTETLNILQTKICQFDGSETQTERNSAQDSLFALCRSMERFKEALDEQVNEYVVQSLQLSRLKPDPEKCEGCTVREKGWCSPLKRYQCEYGYSDEEYIRLLILSLNDKTRKLADVTQDTVTRRESENTAQTYTLDAIARAGASLAWTQGKMGEAIALLARYGVQTVNQLKPERYVAFAADLRTLGAQI